MRRRESHPGYEVGQTLITCRWEHRCWLEQTFLLTFPRAMCACNTALNCELCQMPLHLPAACVRALQRAAACAAHRLTQPLPSPALPYSPSASLHEVLDKIVANRLHRWAACSVVVQPRNGFPTACQWAASALHCNASNACTRF